MSSKPAGKLNAGDLFKQVNVRGLGGKLDSIHVRKAIGRDEVEVQLGLVGNKWSTFIDCDVYESVSFE